MNPGEIIESYVNGNLDDYEAQYFLWHITGVEFKDSDFQYLVEGYRQETTYH